MRFACQSCGKAYNLPEERIADKSNVKLKCRVCGAIVEVKKQGELVAHLLDDADAKRMARVSEAPAPLTSITPEDDDDPEGATVSISEASINDHGPLELEMPAVALPPTGFAAASGAMSSGAMSSAGMSGTSLSGGARMEANLAPPLPPPPLSPSSLPPPPPMRALEAPDAAAHGSNGSAVNGSGAAAGNGSGAFFPDGADSERESDEGRELLAPVAPAAMSGGASLGGVSLGGGASANVMAPSAVDAELPDLPAAPAEATRKDPTFMLKMAAAFVTGVLIDRIVSGLFN